jgi:hypothetical protein
MNRILLLLLLFAVGCTLSADQEAALNNARIEYTNARNNGQVMTYVAYTHPDAVAHYKELGDSAFVAKFGSENRLLEAKFIQDANIRDTEMDGDHIHVKYSFLEIDQFDFTLEQNELFIIAISDDDGKNWFFIEEEDYRNTEIIPEDKQLIK